MFVIKKVLSAFLLPPGMFVLMLSAWGVFQIVRKKSSAGLAGMLLAGLIWALSILPVADLIMGPLEKPYTQFKTPSGDVLVLLGGGIAGEVPDFSGKGVPSADFLSRIITAARLQQQLGIPIIVSGGFVYQNTKSEANVARRLLTDLGVSEQKILLDERSRDTFDNARYSKELCQKLGFKKPILVTSAYHLNRSVYLFNEVGLSVTPFPANFKSATDRKYDWQDFLPSTGSLDITRDALHEYLGQICYRLNPFR